SGEDFGRPLTNLRVELRDRDPSGTHAPRTTSPEESGFFLVSAVQPGSYVARLESTCEGLAISLERGLEIAQGQARARIDFVVPKDSMQGRVLAGESGVDGASILLVDPATGRNESAARTDSAGEYRVVRPADGNYL